MFSDAYSWWAMPTVLSNMARRKVGRSSETKDYSANIGDNSCLFTRRARLASLARLAKIFAYCLLLVSPRLLVTASPRRPACRLLSYWALLNNSSGSSQTSSLPDFFIST
jgi:hypothetical protein